MNVIVIGTVQFTLEMLDIINRHSSLVGVITSITSSLNSDYVDLAPYCTEQNIPLYKTNDVNAEETLRWVSDQSADIVFCLGWSRLINKPLLELVQMGVIGYHPAALPKNRGRHPLIWALVLGLKETASTFFFMDDGADSGDILSQEKIQISDQDDASSLYRKMIETVKEQMPTVLKQLSNGNYSRIPQDDSVANYWRKRGMPDSEIDWRMSANSIHNLVRALTHPYVGAHFFVNDKLYQVWKTRVVDCAGAENNEPAKVLSCESDVFVVKCGEGCIALTEVTPAVSLKKGDYL